MSFRNRLTLAVATSLLLALSTRPAAAQLTGIVNYFNQASGNWNVPGNWSLGTVPNGNIDDFGVVGGVSGVTGLSIANATINTAITDMPGGITLGAAAADNGTLQINSGGSITAAAVPGFAGDGNVYVGVAGIGNLHVDRGGSLTSAGIIEGGNTNSVVRLGSGGSGTATINIGTASFARTTQVIGSNVDFTASVLTLSGTLNEQILSSTQSALKATDTAILGGTLTFSFDPSVTPTLGNAWTIVDARQLAGTFGSINISTAPALPLGQVYSVRTQNGGLGKQVQLAVEQRLVLNVDRGTGLVSISNPGAAPIALDGFSVHSASLNYLNPANFTSLGGTWQTANATTGRINQLNPAAAPSFGVGSSQSLGAIFAPAPTSFGTPTEDLTFDYTQPDGSLRSGVVNYTGTTGFNNLVMRIDPATGAAQLKNTSPFTVNLDDYTIASATGSLDVNGWSSLDDQNAAGGDWQEANLSSNRLSELKFSGSTPLGSGQSFNLGNPFNETTGHHDLTFQFLLHGEVATRTGVVVYETIGGPVPGDYNGNGVVDAADYVVWRSNPGAFGGAAGFNTWRSHFGATSGSGSGVGAQAVPEPTTIALIALLCALCAQSNRARAATH